MKITKINILTNTKTHRNEPRVETRGDVLGRGKAQGTLTKFSGCIMPYTCPAPLNSPVTLIGPMIAYVGLRVLIPKTAVQYFFFTVKTF